MKNCHVCGFACDNEAEVCAICGAHLKQFEQYEKELKKKELEEKNTVKEPMLAASVENVVIAEIYKDVLRDNDIPFTYDENDDSMQIVFGGGFTAVDIYVKEEDLEKAQSLYDDVVNSQMEFENDEFCEAFEEEE